MNRDSISDSSAAEGAADTAAPQPPRTRRQRRAEVAAAMVKAHVGSPPRGNAKPRKGKRRQKFGIAMLLKMAALKMEPGRGMQIPVGEGKAPLRFAFCYVPNTAPGHSRGPAAYGRSPWAARQAEVHEARVAALLASADAPPPPTPAVEAALRAAK